MPLVGSKNWLDKHRIQVAVLLKLESYGVLSPPMILGFKSEAAILKSLSILPTKGVGLKLRVVAKLASEAL